MNENNSRPDATREGRKGGAIWLWILAGGFVVILLVALLLPRSAPDGRSARTLPPHQGPAGGANSSRDRLSARAAGHWRGEAPATAEEIVAGKLQQFGKSRRALVLALAKHHKVEVLDDVKRFFDAVESGRWEEIDAAHQALLQPGEGLNQPRSAELHQIWRSIQETWGAAREAHNWPAQKLLDYGEAVLGSLKPGMIYVGGTDPGCFIPTFLNETSDGERHITLTQNALADGTYLDYLNFLYADRLQTLTQDDSQHAFQNYITDAQKRFQHDQEHPDEPKQVRPGEDIQVNEGRVQVSGQVAVMAINEKLLQTLMDKNPGLSFAMEESFPMASTYTSAAPLGPLLELKRPDGQNNLTVEEARQALDYWRDMSHRFETDTDTLTTPDSRTAYAQMAVAQGNLFASKNYSTEAEQAYRIASELSPSYSTPVENLVALLVRAERSKEGFQLLDNFARNNPDQRVSIEEWRKVLLKQYGSK